MKNKLLIVTFLLFLSTYCYSQIDTINLISFLKNFFNSVKSFLNSLISKEILDLSFTFKKQTKK